MKHIIILITMAFTLNNLPAKKDWQPVISYINRLNFTDATKKNLVIGYGNQGSGFFSNFLGVINNLIWCKKNNFTPIVYWGPENLYFQKEGFNNEKNNGWLYYFKPVSNLSYNSHDKIYSNYYDMDGGHINAWNFLETRKEGHAIIQQYIKLLPVIEKKINDFQKQYMRKKVIGMHIRGTDKGPESPLIPLEEYITIAQDNPDYLLLIATDEQPILDALKEQFPDRVIYYPCYRSKNGKPLHIGLHEVCKAQMGEDVLIEAYLLARCDLFVHSYSNVAFAVHFINPTIESILIHPYQEESIVRYKRVYSNNLNKE